MKLSDFQPQRQYDEQLPDFVKAEVLKLVPKVMIYNIRIHNDQKYGQQVAFDVTYREPSDQSIIQRKTITMNTTQARWEMFERFRDWQPAEGEKKIIGPVRLQWYEPASGNGFWMWVDSDEAPADGSSGGSSDRQARNGKPSGAAKAAAHELQGGAASTQTQLPNSQAYNPVDDDIPF